MGAYESKPGSERARHDVSPTPGAEEGASCVGNGQIPEVGPRPPSLGRAATWLSHTEPRLGSSCRPASRRRRSNPHPLLCGWKEASAREEAPALQAAGPRGDGGGGELPPPRQEGPPQLPFWGPTPHFPISPLNWGGSHCFSQARDLWPLEPVGDRGHGRPWVADAWDPPIAGSARIPTAPRGGVRNPQ